MLVAVLVYSAQVPILAHLQHEIHDVVVGGLVAQHSSNCVFSAFEQRIVVNVVDGEFHFLFLFFIDKQRRFVLVARLQEIDNSITSAEPVSEHTANKVCFLARHLYCLSHQFMMVFVWSKARSVGCASHSTENTLLRLAYHIPVLVKPCQHVEVVVSLGVCYHTFLRSHFCWLC